MSDQPGSVIVIRRQGYDIIADRLQPCPKCRAAVTSFDDNAGWLQFQPCGHSWRGVAVLEPKRPPPFERAIGWESRALPVPSAIPLRASRFLLDIAGLGPEDAVFFRCCQPAPISSWRTSRASSHP